MKTHGNRIWNYSHLLTVFLGRLRLIFCLFSLCAAVCAQPKIAVVAPDKTSRSVDFAERLAATSSAGAKVLDNGLSAAAFAAQNFDKPFNLSVAQAKNAGAAIGANYLLLVKSENLRRASLSKGEFYESYATIFIVSARTGQLVFWKMSSFETESQDEADKKLYDAVKNAAAEAFDAVQKEAKKEAAPQYVNVFENLPVEGSPEAENFRPPLPYKRFRPEYTPLANLYAIEATVDAEIDVDETGKILKVEIVRWAGYGLDESVAANIRKMNWRPAQRNGKNLPLRVLLRYNFKKIDAE